MGYLEIPDSLYLSIYQNQVARLIDKGLDLRAARQMSREIMDHCFIARTASVQCDYQKDFDDERDGDWTR